ncbi:MAG: flagellar motor protein MotB [Janthinobacterium lividum]
MAEPKEESIIIIKRKKAGHGGHHGGAWKVAYADFVTAMMSLFIVLWLTSSADAVKQSVAHYFNDPKGTADKQGTNRNGSGQGMPLNTTDMEKLKDQLLQAERQMPNFEQLKKQVEITEAQDGLRIELLEATGGTFFQSGSAAPTSTLSDFLKLIAPQLGKMQNHISIEGHTDSVPYSGEGLYTNWELSADRANAARRLLQVSGVGVGQVAQVRGFADQLPRNLKAPTDASNRRVTLIVDPGPPMEAPAPAAGGEGGEEKPAAGKTEAAAGKAEPVKMAKVAEEKKGE